jgi:hypothetical protein
LVDHYFYSSVLFKKTIPTPNYQDFSRDGKQQQYDMRPVFYEMIDPDLEQEEGKNNGCGTRPCDDLGQPV